VVFDRDPKGFGVRVRVGVSRKTKKKTTLKAWIFQYGVVADDAAQPTAQHGEKKRRKQRRITIGNANVLKIDKAREIAAELHAKVCLGQDPAAAKAANKAEAATLFKPIVDRYLADRKDNLRPGSYLEVDRHLIKKAKPLHGMPIATIDRSAIANLLSGITSESGQVAANRTR
jgi:hypothetical protein